MADIDTSRFEPNKTQWFQLPSAFPKSNPKLCPSAEWETLFIHYFDSIRKFSSRFLCNECEKPSTSPKLPKLKNKKGWKLFCLGNCDNLPQNDVTLEEGPSNSKTPLEATKPVAGTLPTLGVIKKLDAVSFIFLC